MDREASMTDEQTWPEGYSEPRLEDLGTVWERTASTILVGLDVLGNATT